MGHLPSHSHRQYRSQTRDPRASVSDVDYNDVRHLAAGVVAQAVRDWGVLLRSLAPVIADESVPESEWRSWSVNGFAFSEIEYFFRSEYGSELCELLDLSADGILYRLNKWIKDFKRTGVLPKEADRAIRRGGPEPC